MICRYSHSHQGEKGGGEGGHVFYFGGGKRGQGRERVSFLAKKPPGKESCKTDGCPCPKKKRGEGEKGKACSLKKTSLESSKKKGGKVDSSWGEEKSVPFLLWGKEKLTSDHKKRKKMLDQVVGKRKGNKIRKEEGLEKKKNPSSLLSKKQSVGGPKEEELAA